LYSSPGHGAKLVHESFVMAIILSWAYVGLIVVGYENSFGV
jgi:hypothetical protein